MTKDYIVYIDESGEEGFQKIREKGKSNGSSPYFTLGACFIQKKDYVSILNKVQEIETKLNKDIHCKNLKHFQILHTCREIKELPIITFGLISNKNSINTFTWNPQKPYEYYNKNATYLLERIGKFLSIHNIPTQNCEFIFEEKTSVKYDYLKKYITAIQKTPYNSEYKYLRYIEKNSIIAKEKKQEPLLVLADVVAHALYKACDNDPRCYEITENRYLKEITECFANDEGILNCGIKLVHDINDLELCLEDKKFFQNI